MYPEIPRAEKFGHFLKISRSHFWFESLFYYSVILIWDAKMVTFLVLFIKHT